MASVRLAELTPARAIFDLEDRFARDRGVRGNHPRPIGTVRYSIIGRVTGGVRADFKMPVRLLTVRNSSGYDLFFDRVKQARNKWSTTETTPLGYDLFFDRVKQGDLAASRMDFEEGTYVLRIDAQFYQRSEHEIFMPKSDAAHSIDLEPSYFYPFPIASLPHGGSPTLLRGTLHKTDGSGVEDVTIQVADSSNAYLTDEAGQWVLIFNEGVPSGDVAVTFTWLDGTVVDVAAVRIVKGQERSLVQAGLRGWVKTVAGVAIAGASVRVNGHPGETKSAHDGSWFSYFGLNQPDEVVSVSVTLINGRIMTQHGIQVKSRAVVVVPTFSFV